MREAVTQEDRMSAALVDRVQAVRLDDVGKSAHYNAEV